MKPVPIDLFCRMRFPCGLRAGPGGAYSFTVRQAVLKDNAYRRSLWLGQNGRPPRRLAGAGEFSAHWWAGQNSLLLAGPGGAREKEWAKKGLPFTLLRLLLADGAGKARVLARLFLEVEEALALPGGSFLLLARWDPDADAALLRAKGNAGKAARLLAEEAGCRVLSCLPFWENGGGFTGRKRRRLYLLKDGKAAPLTDELTEVSLVRLAPGGGSAFFAARHFETKMPVADSLFRLDMASLTVTELPWREPFLCEAVVPLSDTEVLVAGSDMKARGLNQNAGFYRLCLPAAGKGESARPLFQPLYEGGAYSAGNSVCTDLSLAGESGGPFWQAEGGWVYWVSTLGESSHLMRIDPGSGAIEQVSRCAGAVQAIARCGGATVAIAQRGLYGPEVYRIEDDGREKRLSSLNTGAARRYAFTQPQPLAYTNAGGYTIRGWVLRPPAPKAGAAPQPAVLAVHGGPKTVYGPVLFHEMQYLASQGFAVLYCNPTGSDGGGDAFADIRGRYGGVDYDDIMGFLDAALARCDFIDPKRLGICGGSYGGFMTNWAVGHSRRFAAAVSQRGISNWAGMAVTSDIGYYFVPSEMKGGDAGEWWAHSPLKYAGNVETPTLFIHSDEDYRCPLPEGLQMYGALADRGVPARLCLFSGENHELSRSGRPKNRLRRLEEITRWFLEYL